MGLQQCSYFLIKNLSSKIEEFSNDAEIIQKYCLLETDVKLLCLLQAISDESLSLTIFDNFFFNDESWDLMYSKLAIWRAWIHRSLSLSEVAASCWISSSCWKTNQNTWQLNYEKRKKTFCPKPLHEIKQEMWIKNKSLSIFFSLLLRNFYIDPSVEVFLLYYLLVSFLLRNFLSLNQQMPNLDCDRASLMSFTYIKIDG